MLVMKNTTPKPPNRRIADRSVVARDSSWPDCQESWKPGSSRCRWAYRSSRIDRSMPATAPAWTQRRKKFRNGLERAEGDRERRRARPAAPRLTCLMALSIDRLGEQRDRDLGADAASSARDDHEGQRGRSTAAGTRGCATALRQESAQRKVRCRLGMRTRGGWIRGHYSQVNCECPQMSRHISLRGRAAAFVTASAAARSGRSTAVRLYTAQGGGQRATLALWPDAGASRSRSGRERYPWNAPVPGGCRRRRGGRIRCWRRTTTASTAICRLARRFTRGAGTRGRRARNGGPATWPVTCAASPTTTTSTSTTRRSAGTRGCWARGAHAADPGQQAGPAERGRAGRAVRRAARRAHRRLRRRRPAPTRAGCRRSGTCRTTSTATRW